MVSHLRISNLYLALQDQQQKILVGDVSVCVCVCVFYNTYTESSVLMCAYIKANVVEVGD